MMEPTMKKEDQVKGQVAVDGRVNAASREADRIKTIVGANQRYINIKDKPFKETSDILKEREELKAEVIKHLREGKPENRRITDLIKKPELGFNPLLRSSIGRKIYFAAERMANSIKERISPKIPNLIADKPPASAASLSGGAAATVAPTTGASSKTLEQPKAEAERSLRPG